MTSKLGGFLALKKQPRLDRFLILLKRAKVPTRDIISFYLTCIRPVFEYCAPFYHHALPDYLSNYIEHVQKRALSIISPGLLYLDNLSLFNLNSLKDRRIEQCNKFRLSIYLIYLSNLSIYLIYLSNLSNLIYLIYLSI